MKKLEKIDEMHQKLDGVYDKINKNGKLDKIMSAVHTFRKKYGKYIIILLLLMFAYHIYETVTYPQVDKKKESVNISYMGKKVEIKLAEDIFNNKYEEEGSVKGKVALENKFKAPVSTRSEYKEFKTAKITVTASIPEFNVKKEDANKEIYEYIDKLEERLRENLESKSSTKEEYKVKYTAYGIDNVISLAILESIDGKSNVKVFAYDYKKKKLITMTEYLKREKINHRRIALEIRKELASRVHSRKSQYNIVINKEGDMYIVGDNGKSLLVDITK